jgi:hypothetical protein
LNIKGENSSWRCIANSLVIRFSCVTNAEAVFPFKALE